MSGKLFEQRLAEFVDRSKEVQLFCDVVERGERPIVAFWGRGGVGKTSLLMRMKHECARRGLKFCALDWKTYSYDYMWTMRCIRDDVGVAHFNGFTDLINYFTVPQYELKIRIDGNVSVLQGAAIDQSTTGDIAGVIVKDFMVPEPRRDIQVPEDEKRWRLTDAFLKNFSEATKGIGASGPLVIFLDTIEKMTAETQAWVWHELLAAVAAERLCNVRFVLCGRDEPPRDIDRDLRLLIEDAELEPLQPEHIVEYLERRGVDADVREALAMMLMVNTKGNPFSIATNVDAFLEMKRKRSLGRG